MIGDDACITFVRYGGGSRNKQDYKPDIKLEYYDDNGRFLSPKEVLTVCSIRTKGHARGFEYFGDQGDC